MAPNESSTQILVVDDDKIVLALFKRAAQRVGCSLRGVESVEEGLELMMDHKFIAVITDVRLPGVGGMAFAEWLHNDHPEIPCILVSAVPDEELSKLAESVRATCQAKPLSIATVVKMLQPLAKYHDSKPTREAATA